MKRVILAFTLIFHTLAGFSQIKILNKNDIVFENYYFKALNAYLYDDSVKLFHYANLALKNNPASAATNFILGKYLFVKKHYQLALEYFLKAMSLNDQNYWYNYYLAQTYIKLNLIGEAVNVLQQLSQKHGTGQLYLKLIDLFIQQNNYPKALSLSKKYLQLYGLDLNIGLKLISIYKNTNDTSNLQTILEQMIKSYPYNIILYKEFWETMSKNHKYQEIIKFYHSNSKVLSDYYFILLAKAYYKSGKTDSALIYTKRLLLSPEIPVNDKIKTLEYLEKLTPEQLLGLYRILYDNYPYKPEICYKYGLLLYKNFMIDKSLSIFKTCSNTLNSFEYFLLYSKILILKHNFSSLNQLMDQAIINFPNSPEFYYLKALALIQQNKQEDAQSLINYAKMLDFENRHQLLLILLNSIKNKQAPGFNQIQNLLKTAAHKCFYFGLYVLYTNVLPSGIEQNNCQNNTFFIIALTLKYKQLNNQKKLNQLTQLYPNLINLKPKN